MFLTGAEEGYAKFDVEGTVAGGWPGEVRERRGVLGRGGGAGERLEGFEGDDPVADAGTKTFGVEGALGSWRKQYQLSGLSNSSVILCEMGRNLTKGLISNNW